MFPIVSHASSANPSSQAHRSDSTHDIKKRLIGYDEEIPKLYKAITDDIGKLNQSDDYISLAKGRSKVLHARLDAIEADIKGLRITRNARQFLAALPQFTLRINEAKATLLCCDALCRENEFHLREQIIDDRWAPPYQGDIKRGFAAFSEKKRDEIFPDAVAQGGSSSLFGSLGNLFGALRVSDATRQAELVGMIDEVLGKVTEFQSIQMQRMQAIKGLDDNAERFGLAKLPKEMGECVSRAGLMCGYALKLSRTLKCVSLFNKLSADVAEAKAGRDEEAVRAAQEVFEILGHIERKANLSFEESNHIFTKALEEEHEEQEGVVGRVLQLHGALKELAWDYEAFANLPALAGSEHQQSFAGLAEECRDLQRLFESKLTLLGYVAPKLPPMMRSMSAQQMKLQREAGYSGKSGAARSGPAPRVAAVVPPPRRMEARVSSLPETKDDPLDSRYFSHLMPKSAASSGTNSASIAARIAAENETRYRKTLEGIRRELSRPSYELKNLGRIGKGDLIARVKRENALLSQHAIYTNMLAEVVSARQSQGKGRQTGQDEAAAIRAADRRLQIDVSMRQFPNLRAVNCLLVEGVLSIKQVGNGGNAVVPDRFNDGVYATYDSYALGLNSSHHDNTANKGGTYALAHAHYQCDDAGRALLDEAGNKRYLSSHSVGTDGTISFAKAIHLKHPDHDKGRNHEELTGENVHRWMIGEQEFRMMLANLN